jgi:hypothetical protein
MNNVNRTDMTNWLIHFIHNKKDDGIPESLPSKIENSICYPCGVADYDAFFSLKNIIMESGIRYGYSFRNKKTTLYGGDPVICFSEMPFYNYLQYIASRNDLNYVSPYGIAIEKSNAFNLGARPVIYGLANNVDPSYVVKNSYCRILEDSFLLKCEQFRFVSFTGTRDNDWTHEREWRLKNYGDNTLYNEVNGYLCEFEGLPIFDKDIYSGRIILITNTLEEAKNLQEVVLNLLDSKANDFDTPFNNYNIYFLVIEEYKSFSKKTGSELFRIEDLTEECYFVAQKYNRDEKLRIKINNCFDYARNTITRNAAEEFIVRNKLTIKNNAIDYKDVCGWAKVICYSANHKIVRELVNMELAIPFQSYYEIKAVGGGIPSTQCITYHKYIAEKVKDYLNKELDNIFYATSTLD